MAATLMRKMNVISRCEALYRTQCSSTKLPGIYHSYVLTIVRRPGLSQDKLAQHLCINKSSVTRHLAYLEKNGYIRRETSPEDKREQLVYPTDKMQELHPEVVEITRAWNQLIAEDISEEELLLFHHLLDQMAENSRRIIAQEQNL